MSSRVHVDIYLEKIDCLKDNLNDFNNTTQHMCEELCTYKNNCIYIYIIFIHLNFIKIAFNFFMTVIMQ